MPKTTIKQYEEIIAFLEGEGNKSILDKSKDNKVLWNKLVKNLNRIGPKKTLEHWKKVKYDIFFVRNQ